MNRTKSSIIIIGFLSIFSLSACSDGPAETTGEKIDEAMTDTKNKIEDTCEEVKSEMDMNDKDC